MRNCGPLGVTVGNLEGAIIHLEQHKTLHSNPSYQSALNLLKEELATAAKAYIACMNGSQ